MLFLLFFSSSVTAQNKNKCFEHIAKPKLVDENSTKFLNHLTSKSPKQLQFIQFDDKIDDEAGELTFSLPDKPREQITMPITNAILKSETNFHLHAANEDGYISLMMVEEGYYGGSIHYKDKEYAIYSIKKKISVIIERDLEKEAKENKFTCANEEERPVKKGNRIAVDCTGDYGSAELQIVGAITPAAKIWLNTYISTDTNTQKSWLHVQIGSMNTAFFNSGINNKYIGWKLVYLTTDPYPYRPMRIGLDATDSLPISPSILQLKTNNNADVVVLLSNNYATNSLGFASTLLPENTNKFAIVEVKGIGMYNLTFSHEVAHLIGCRHDNSTEATCNKGYKFIADSLERGTIMATSVPLNANSPFAYVNHYSNPNISYNTVPTGTANNNNAGVLNNHFCQAASINSPSEFSVVINGSLCNGANSTFTASVTQGNILGYITGVAPYTYYWSWSSSAYGPWTSFGSNSSSTTLPSQSPCSARHIRVFVYSSDGYNTSKANFYSCVTCGNSNEFDLETRSINKTETINVYPNPSDRIFEIQTDIEVSSYKLYGIDSKLILEQDKVNTKMFSIDLTNQPKNIYLLHLHLTSGERITRKIMLHHE